jgi:hypothetical protein
MHIIISESDGLLCPTRKEGLHVYYNVPFLG